MLDPYDQNIDKRKFANLKTICGGITTWIFETSNYEEVDPLAEEPNAT